MNPSRLIQCLRDSYEIHSELYIGPSSRRLEGRGYAAVPRWVRWVRLSVCAPIFGLHQWYGAWVWGGRDDRPVWPLDVFAACTDWIERRLAKHETWYRWDPPDSGLPNEIGFWSLSDGSHQRSETRIYIGGNPTLSYAATDHSGTTWTALDPNTPVTLT